MENSFYGTGRRKSSVARVFLKPGKGDILINKKEISSYFSRRVHIENVNSPFNLINSSNKFDLFVTVKGGGETGQAGAIRLGLARALVSFDNNYKSKLKSSGFLTRDSRMVERKKCGKPKARKSPQFSKR